MSLSFCLIAKNEAGVIKESLQSILPVADEIIVGVDDRTNDGTDEIVRAFGVKPFYFHWINNFAWARNLTMEKATGSHIFIIDADERLTQQGQQLVNILMKQANMPDETFAFNVRNIKKTGELIKVTLGPIRLVPNKKEIRYQYVMHETLMNTGICHYMPIEVLDHVGFDQAVGKTEERAVRNIRLLHDRILQNFNDADSWRYAAFFYRFIDMNDEAAICADEALRLPGEFNPDDYRVLEVIRSKE